jgi:hypothetical protein
MGKDDIKIKWFDEPEEHDYPAALSYLSLLYDEATASGFVENLQNSHFVQYNLFRSGITP